MTGVAEVRVSASSLEHNLSQLRTLAPSGAQIAAVVKGNAYGHGLTEVVEVLDGKVHCFQVDDLDELRALRRVSSARVMVLGYVPVERFREALDLGAELALFDIEQLPALEAAGAALGKRPKVHLEVDSLLGRLGVMPGELGAFLECLKRHPDIEVVTAYAHFANIEDTTDLGHALAQVDAFSECFGAIRQAGWDGIGRHMSATSGLMTVEQVTSANDLIRLGIGLYGMYPSAALARRFAYLGLRPAMAWVSRLAQVKMLPAKHPVGYGLTYLTPFEMPVGIVPQGYSDGYDRHLSNSGEVLVHGVRCPVVGRVAMNMFAVDLSAAPNARAGDEVALLGAQGEDRITAEELAARIGTINYEVTVRVSPLLPRATR